MEAMRRAVPPFVVWASVATAIPFILFGIWLYRIALFGSTLSALLTIVATLVLVLGTVFLLVQARQMTPLKNLFLNFPKLLTVGFAALFAWLILSWFNLLFVSDFSTRAQQPVILVTLIVLGLVFFTSTGLSGETHRWAIALSGFAGALIIAIGHVVTGGTQFLYPPLTQFLLVPLALLLFLGSRFWPVLLAVPIVLHAILLTGARMPSAVAILLIGLGSFMLPFWNKWIRSAILAVSTAVVAGHFLSRDLVNRRWFERGDGQIVLPSLQSSERPGLVLNSSGRIDVWQHLIEKVSPQTLTTGNGVGSSGKAASDLTGGAIDQPLNEYLRLFIDFGPAVLVLWLIAMTCLFFFGLTMAKYDRAETFLLLGLILALGIMSLTDIPMLLTGFMLPFVIVVGQSLRSLMDGETHRKMATQLARPQSLRDAE